MIRLHTISTDLYCSYNAIEATAKTPDKLDRLIDEKSTDILLLGYRKLLYRRFGLATLSTGSTITLAVAFPVASIAFVILCEIFEASRRFIKLLQGEERVKGLLKSIVLSVHDESEIDLLLSKTFLSHNISH